MSFWFKVRDLNKDFTQFIRRKEDYSGLQFYTENNTWLVSYHTTNLSYTCENLANDEKSFTTWTHVAIRYSDNSNITCNVNAGPDIVGYGITKLDSSITTSDMDFYFGARNSRAFWDDVTLHGNVIEKEMIRIIYKESKYKTYICSLYIVVSFN